MKRYHFCSKEFLKALQTQQTIEAGPHVSKDHNKYAYDFLFLKKQLNNGNGMFFLWEDPEKKGIPIQFVEEVQAEFVLLELNIPKGVGIETDYDNWCSFIMDLHEADGDLQVADEICREFGIEDGLQGSYQAIFATDDSSIIQTLIPYLKWDWITAIHYTLNKVV